MHLLDKLPDIYYNFHNDLFLGLSISILMLVNIKPKNIQFQFFDKTFVCLPCQPIPAF